MSDAATGRPERPETVILPLPGFRIRELVEVVRYRGLLYGMARRQLKSEYGNLFFGFAWAVARPLTMMLVFVLFKNLAQAQTGVAIPYPLYLYSGLLVWFFFTESAMEASTSLQRDAGLIRKVYYPRLLSPMVPILANLFGLAVASVPLVAIAGWYEVYPDWHIVMLPLVIGQLAALILGLGCIFATLTLASRDWERMLGLALYVGLFLSPVIYLPDRVPEAFRAVYFANPMAGTLAAVRASLFSEMAFPWQPWLYALAVSLALMFAGIALFQRFERALIDRL